MQSGDNNNFLYNMHSVISFFFELLIVIFFLHTFFLLDADECNASVRICDENAICQNTLGSFFCTCKSGFSGNGFTCVGRLLASLLACSFNEKIYNLYQVNEM